VEKQSLAPLPIVLQWSAWYPWPSLLIDGRAGGIAIPNYKPGVYEARLKGANERLTIGKASDLRRRVRQGLVKGMSFHSSGDGIRANEDTSKVEVRWAETKHRAAAEEELHRQHVAKYGRLPKYTKH